MLQAVASRGDAEERRRGGDHSHLLHHETVLIPRAYDIDGVFDGCIGSIVSATMRMETPNEHGY